MLTCLWLYCFALIKASMAWLQRREAPNEGSLPTSKAPVPGPSTPGPQGAEPGPAVGAPPAIPHRSPEGPTPTTAANEWDELERDFNPSSLEMALLTPYEQTVPHQHLRALHHMECPRNPCECSPGLVPIDHECRCLHPQDLYLPLPVPGGPHSSAAPRSEVGDDQPLHLEVVRKAMVQVTHGTPTRKRIWGETHFDLCSIVYFETKQAARLASQEFLTYIAARPVTFLALLPFLQNLPKDHPHFMPRLDQGKIDLSLLPFSGRYDLMKGWVSQEVPCPPTWTAWARPTPTEAEKVGTRAPTRRGGQDPRRGMKRVELELRPDPPQQPWINGDDDLSDWGESGWNPSPPPNWARRGRARGGYAGKWPREGLLRQLKKK